MEIIKKKTKELKENKKNIRKHPEEQINEYVKSLKMFGQIKPIIIDENNVILAGNGLFIAAQKAGIKNVDCIVMNGLDEKQKIKIMLADNKIYELGRNDMSTFDNILRELDGEFDIPGYDPDILKELLVTIDEVMEDIQEPVVIIQNKTQTIEPIRQNEKQEIVQEVKPQQRTEEEITEGKYIVCPHCKQKIWI